MSYDVIVIGAGPAGEVAAGRLADGGLKVAIVEEHLVGGECSFYACMPSKALLRPGEALAEAKRVVGDGVDGSTRIKAAAVLKRRDEIIHDLDDTAQLPWLSERSIDLIRGSAKLVGERRVVVNDEEFLADKAVVVASGSVAAIPPVEGLEEAMTWTNREATTAKQVPDSLLVLGGGPVGVELAQAWASLGSSVTLIEGERRLLPREEQFACEQVTEALTDLGVDIKTGLKLEKAERVAGDVLLRFENGSEVRGRELLVATGRRPRVENLGLEKLGLKIDRPLEVNGYYGVRDVPWLYAVGDVNGIAPLTHMGKYQARRASDYILGIEPAPSTFSDGQLSPRVTFTDPQVAAVGHTTHSAKEAGIDFEVVDVSTSGNAGGSFYGHNAPGQTRFVLERDSQCLIGVTITGSEIADFIHSATIAVSAKLTRDQLAMAVPVFPTRSEIWLALT